MGQPADAPPDAVVLVGHGAAPDDCPRELVQRWKALEGRRRAAGAPPGDEERALDAQLRGWPRTAASDPYGAGLRRLGQALRPLLGSAELVVRIARLLAEHALGTSR